MVDQSTNFPNPSAALLRSGELLNAIINTLVTINLTTGDLIDHKTDSPIWVLETDVNVPADGVCVLEDLKQACTVDPCVVDGFNIDNISYNDLANAQVRASFANYISAQDAQGAPLFNKAAVPGSSQDNRAGCSGGFVRHLDRRLKAMM